MSTKPGRGRRARSCRTTTAALAATATAFALGGGGSAVAQDCAGADAQPGPDVAALAAAVECLVNQERAAAGVARVPSDPRLVAAAQAHAREMVDRNAFSTTGPDGSTPADRARRAGYPSAPVGETIAFGTGDLATPRRIVAGWMADTTSRARLVATRGVALGSAAVAGTPGNAGGDGATYVVDLATTGTGGTGGPGDTGAAAVAGRTAVVQAVRGTVYVLAPGGTRTALRAAGTGARAAAYSQLSGRVTIPMGSRLDTRVGTVRIATAADRTGTQQTATFRDGIFRLTQARTGDLVVNFQLVQPLAPCARSRTAQASRKQGSPRRKTRRRSLFGSGKGRYRTRGRYASATVRGTQWTTTDSCDGTRVTVRTGVVDVRDTRTGQVVAVRAGRSILVPRKRAG